MSSSLIRMLHRVTGLSVAVLVIGFVATGIPLQFTDTLQLGSRGVPYPWVHAAYRVEIPSVVRSSNGVVQAGDMLFARGRVLRVEGELRGALSMSSVLAVVTSSELLLLPADEGMPVDRTAIEQAVSRFGTTPRRALVVDTPLGVLVSDDLGASWRQEAPAAVNWLEVDTVPTDPTHARRFGAAHVTWERWLQDLHSGRFFGPVGVLVMSITAIALLVLSVSGFVVWFFGRKTSKTV